MSKAIRLSILVPLALVSLYGSALAQGGVTNSTKNPQQVATMHWYPANLITSFPVGTAFGRNPVGVTFDGDNIWVTSTSSVFKLRASDGANLGNFPVGNSPAAVAFDGANIWVANQGSNNVTRLRASDGANLGSFSTGLGPNAIAFDGTSVWITNSGSNSITRLP